MLRPGGADFFFDGDTGIIAHFLAQTGQRIEEGGFATVWIANDGVDRRPIAGGRRAPAGRRRDV